MILFVGSTQEFVQQLANLIGIALKFVDHSVHIVIGHIMILLTDGA